jgi:hypothetical protein
MLRGGGVVLAAGGVDVDAGLGDGAGCEAEEAELGAVAFGALAALAAAFGLEVVEADGEFGVLGRSAGNGVRRVRAAANLVVRV